MLQAKILQSLEEVTHLDAVCRAFVCYACRLVGATEIQRLNRLPLTPPERAAIRSVKDWLDCNIYRNSLYSAIWYLAGQERRTYRATAKRYGLDPDELRYLFQLLTEHDCDFLLDCPEPYVYSDNEIVEVLRLVQKHIRRIVKTRLRYCYTNDDSLTYEDCFAEMQVQAIKIIRNYEVLGLTPEEMASLVAQGITNHAINIAVYYGKESRNPLRRLVTQKKYRWAWYCNVNEEIVEKAKVLTGKQYRKGDYCLVHLQDGQRYVPIFRLHEKKAEARDALHRYLQGQKTGRAVYIDLTPKRQDDWQPTTMSIDTPASPDAAPLINFLSGKSDHTDEIIFDFENTTNDPRVRTFLQVVTGVPDALFSDYCKQATGRTPAEITDIALGRVARKYCNLTARELTKVLPFGVQAVLAEE